MTTILITFLGKSDSYAAISYRFPDGKSYPDESNFHLVLHKHLNPDKTVILGTQSSSWNNLFQTGGQTPEEYRKSRNQLKRLIENNENELVANEKDLRKDDSWQNLIDFLTKQYDAKMEIGIIDYGQDETEQISILREVSSYVNQKDQLYLDITHGFRHLPMLVVLVALYLKSAKDVEIKGIYYGAFDLRVKNGDEYAPVLDLKGLLSIADWVGALNQLGKDGDYGVFSKLLQEDGLPKKNAIQLEKAAFYERNFNISGAKQELSVVYNQLDDNLKGLSKLFVEPLQQRLEWHTQGSENPYARQRNRAEFFLKNRDYLRASLFAFEAYITWNMKENWNDYEKREETRLTLTDNNYHKLRILRNLLAHGSFKEENNMSRKERETWKEIRNWIKDEIRLKEELRKLINALFKP